MAGLRRGRSSLLCVPARWLGTYGDGTPLYALCGMLMRSRFFSLMITSKQVKAEDPRLRNLLYVYIVVSRAVCKKVFSSHSEVFSLEVVWAHHL